MTIIITRELVYLITLVTFTIQ